MKTENDWPVTTHRYVAYIDIMGFKDMITRLSHNEVYEMMKKIDDIKNHMESVDWVESNSKLVKTTTYSDSIIVYSKDSSYESFDFLVSTISGLTNNLFVEGIPFKGAFAFGMMTLDTEKSIFFGQPLIDAYLLQEEIYFYGVLFHATVETEIENNNLNWPPFIEPYLCNLKAGTANHRTIYPLYAKQKDDEKYNKNYEELIKGINKLRLKTSGHLRQYIDNTEKYLSHILSTTKNKIK